MFELIEFKNFKILRDATLSLRPFTLILGPNGSGKSTVLQGLKALQNMNAFSFRDIVTVGSTGITDVSVTVKWSTKSGEFLKVTGWSSNGQKYVFWQQAANRTAVNNKAVETEVSRILDGIRVYAFENDALIRPVMLTPEAALGPNGENLAGVLDRLRDQEPERFEAINEELRQWLPEFDTLLFETPSEGHRSVNLRMKRSGAVIRARDFSQGTLQALAILTIAYLRHPPSVIGIEEPDRGIHPRLLRQVRDALYRLSYPDQFGETRPPTQVIATTHSPYFLDLFRDRPEEVVLAEKVEDGARFIPLSSYEHLEEILRDTQLGEAWYTGILGGVPANT